MVGEPSLSQQKGVLNNNAQWDVDAHRAILVDYEGTIIDVQHPLPTDGDSIYVKDIWLEESSSVNFTGSILDLFDNLHSQIVNSSSDNPKTLDIHFNRTVISNAVGLGNTGDGDFSNVKIQLKNSGGVLTTVIDESTDNTKYTTRTFQLPITAGFNALVITFNTADTISLSNCVILKTASVVARLQAAKPDNTITDINATTGGNLKISLEEFDETFYTNPLPVADFRLLVAEGLIPGHSTVHKYGRGANIDTVDGFVDLWDGAEYDNALKTYTFSTTADIDRVSSSDATDTQNIIIEGLDINGDFVSQSKTLTGQTPVALDTSLWRVFRMYNDDSTDFAGQIFCFVNVTTTAGVPDTITNTRAMINDGNNQTLMSIYTIPNGKTGYVEHWYGVMSAARTSNCNLRMRARPFGKVFRLKHTSTLESTGSSHIQHNFEYPQKLPAKTDMIMSADTDVNDNAVSAGFELLLVDD